MRGILGSVFLHVQMKRLIRDSMCWQLSPHQFVPPCRMFSCFISYPADAMDSFLSQISGKADINDADKTHNKILAEALVEKGIHVIVEAGDDDL